MVRALEGGSKPFTETENTVLNNGYASKWIKPSRGKDGPFLLVLTAELMSNKIRHSDSVKGVSLFGNEVKLSQCSDDTTPICTNTKSVESALQTPTDFGRISGQDFLIGLVHRRYHRPTGGAALAVGLEKGEIFKKYSQN